MKWGLVAKPASEPAFKEIKQLYEHLVKTHKQSVVCEKILAAALKVKGKPLDEIEADIYVTIGGDGTILLTLMQTESPVLAVNLGGIGFLSEVEPKYARSAVDRILANDFHVEERSKLASYLEEERLPDAANEVTVQTAKIAKLIKFRIEINGEVVDTLRGDGVICATATGSTGYSLSVGGPILHPAVHAIVISPIAPFRLAARPLVIPYESTTKITLLERRSGSGDKDAKVVIDGQHGYGLPYNGTVTVKPSPKKARFIRFNGGFYDRVRTKLTR